MKQPDFSSLRAKLLALLIGITTVPILITGVLLMNLSSKTIERANIRELDHIRKRKAEQIVTNLREHLEDLTFVTTNITFRNAISSLKAYHQTSGELDESNLAISTVEYQEINSLLYAYFSTIKENWGFYDLFLVCAEHGHVMYSVAGERDLGTNLRNGQYSETGLAEVWNKVMRTGNPALVDFRYYEPSKVRAAFMGIPVYDKRQEIDAVFVLQENLDNLGNIFDTEIIGSESGGVYLIGQDLVPRSRIYSLEAEYHQDIVDTESSRAAVAGGSGAVWETNDSGRKVLSSYGPVGLADISFLDAGFDWGIIAEKEASEVLGPVTRLRHRLLLMILLLLSLAIALALLTSRRITQPIVRLADIATKIGGGDLRIEVDKSERGDEIGVLQNAFRSMKIALRDQVEEMTEGASILSAATSEITTTLRQFSNSSQETVSSVSETTSTVEEVRQTVKVALERAEEISESTQKTIEVSSRGIGSVEATIRGMETIHEQMNSIAESIMKLSDQSQAIGNIVNTINNLAEQSNLLAVNAAIEAARAGDEGKGFSVVAQEVKNLAEQSKSATRQVKEILMEVQKATSDSVMATEQGSKAVTTGLARADEAAESIKSLSEVIRIASQATLQIGASTKQQFIGIDQVNEAMQNINTASVQSLESSRQLETAAGRLQELAVKLADQMDHYKL